MTTTHTTVEELNPESDHIADWVRMRALAHAAGGQEGPPVCAVDAAGSLDVAPPAARAVDLVATKDGTPLGWVRAVIPDLERAPVVVESLVVHPDHRGRGVGGLLAERACSLAAEAGRNEVTLAVPEALLPVASAWGALPKAVSHQVFQRLDLTGKEQPHAGLILPDGVRAVTWATIAPDHIAEGVARLEGHADLTILRSLERMRRTRGRTALHVALVADDGRVLGYTSMSLPASSPQDPEQGMTMVDPQERGHGYGALLKRLGLAGLLHARPWTQRVWTANDEQNRPMATLNTRLGFLPWQVRHVHAWRL